MNCNYCSVRAFAKLQKGRNYRERSVYSIIKEMKYLHENYNIKKFDFIDDNFMPYNPEKAKDKINLFCEEVKKLNIEDIKIFIQCRPDNIHLDLIQELKKIGLKGVFIGIESVNQNDLELYGKNITVEKILRVMDGLNELGFNSNVNSKHRLKVGFITFNPYSTRESLRNSARFLQKYDITPKKMITLLQPLYKTKIYDQFSREDLLASDGSAKFVDPKIDQIYQYSNEIISKIWSFRDRVRLPYKIAIELETIEADPILDDLRVELDTACYDVFNELLNADIDEFDAIRDKYLNYLTSLQENQELMDHLKQIETNCGIDLDNPQLIHFR